MEHPSGLHRRARMAARSLSPAARGRHTRAGRLEAGLVMGPAGWIAMVIWIAVLLVMVWLLVRPTAVEPAEDAMAILRARFARGEISQAEYQQARSELLDDQETTR